MKYFTLILFAFLLGNAPFTFAQQNGGKRAKQLEAIKIGYITRRLDLTPEESKRFWPVYNQYQTELNELLRAKKQNRNQNSADPDKSIDADFGYDTKILEVRKRYRIAFGKLLSAEKVKALYIAERDFREELIRQLKQRNAGD